MFGRTDGLDLKFDGEAHASQLLWSLEKYEGLHRSWWVGQRSGGGKEAQEPSYDGETEDARACSAC